MSTVLETEDEFWFRLLGDRDPGSGDIFAQAFTEGPIDLTPDLSGLDEFTSHEATS